MVKLFVILFLFPGAICASGKDTLNIDTPHDLLYELRHASDNGGKVNITSAPAVNDLVQLHVYLNKKQKTFTGYRIQIFSGSSYDSKIEQLRQMKEDFETEFPDIPAYLKYFDPDFKIRAGNFYSRLDCIPALHRIRKKYPASYPVKTEIPFSDMKPRQIIETEEVLTE